MNIKRLDRLIQQCVRIRNEIANAPEVDLDLERELQVVETSVNLLAEVVDEELSE
jgi:hypothetical protein